MEQLLGIYADRNGETDSPTLPGYYWFRGSIGNVAFDAGITNLTMGWRNGEMLAWDFHHDEQKSIDEFSGQWWGPIEPPWKPEE